MKTPFTLLMVFCFICFETIAQDNHEVIENLFKSKSFAVFEKDLKLSASELQNAVTVDLVNKAYQDFYTSTILIYANGKVLTPAQFELNYQETLTTTLKDLAKKPGVPNPPAGPEKSLNGPCVNMDLESGDFNGWELTRGDVNGATPFSFVAEVPTLPGIFHSIVTAGADPVTGIPMVNPTGGGTFSARLGDGTGVGATCARMKQTFLVDATNFLYTYSYAVIFESPVGHTPNQLPYFTVRVFDENGTSVPCGEYSVIANLANASDYQSTNFAGSTILYRDWQTVFTNLSAYIGQNVTVEFSSGDCSLSGHFGYAYIEATCGLSQEITSSNPIICTGETAVLTAPAGAASYLWSNGATTQTTTISAGGTYTCTLTPLQGGGCSLTLSIAITENPTPIANFTSSAANACLTSPLTFTDASTIPAPGTITSYQWDFGDGTATLSSSGAISGVANTSGTYLLPTHTYQTAGTYTVTLSVVSADGCTDSYSSSVTINPLPIVVAGPNQTVCQGTSITVNGSGANSYTWTNGVVDGIPFAQPVGTTIYTVTGTDVNGCQNTSTVTVLVNLLPVVSAGPDQVVCENQTVTLSGSGAQTYTWSNGVTNGVSFTQVPGTIVYDLNGTDANGCQNTDQVQLIVNPLPVVSGGANLTVCASNTITLTGSGAVSYTWDNGITNGIPFTQAPGVTMYTVIGTDAFGCQNTAQVSVTSLALPIVVGGPDQTVCAGNTVILSGSGALTYDWSGGIVNGISFLPNLGTTVFTVVGTDANGCQNTAQVNVNVNPLPTVDAGQNQVVCENDWITLTANSTAAITWSNGITNGLPFQQIAGTEWYIVTATLPTGCWKSDSAMVLVNDNPVISAVDQIICEGNEAILSGNGATTYLWSDGILNGIGFYPSETKIYTVIGTDNNGCKDTATATVTVNLAPIVDFKILNLNLTTVDPTTAFDNLTTGATSYYWDFSDGGTSTLFEPTHSFPDQNPGDYTITLTAYSAHGCPASKQKYVHLFQDHTIFVPNTFTPDGDGNNDLFFPVMDGFDPYKYTLYIFNRWGQIIFESHDMNYGWDGSYHGEKAVEDGVYTWKIEAGILGTADTKVYVGHVSILQ